MRYWRGLAVAILWAVSLVGVALWAQQAPIYENKPKPGDADGPVLTGEDLGFQRTIRGPHDINSGVHGYFVIKVDGRWQRVGPPAPFNR
jgi:hypothetical protein